MTRARVARQLRARAWLYGVLTAIAFYAFVGGATAMAQTDIPPNPTSAMLTTVAGIAVIVAVAMNLLRTVIPPVTFDQWAALGAVILGIVLAELGTFQRGETTYVDALLVGLFGGVQSQLFNTVIKRTADGLNGANPKTT